MAGLVRSVRISDGLQAIYSYPVLSTSTFLKGDILTFNGSGQLVQPLAALSNYLASDTNYIVGQAQQNAVNDSGVAAPFVNVAIAQPGTRFWFPLYHSTPASAIFTPGTTNAFGTAYQLKYYSALAGFVVDLTQTSNGVVRVIDVWSDDYQGTNTWPASGVVTAGTVQYPLVLCEFLAAHAWLTGAR